MNAPWPTLSALLAAAAAADPSAPAVIDGDRSVTYGELEATSARLAGLLLHLGVRPGDRVGLYLDKSADAVMALHAVVRAGAAVVPLDPKAPTGRLAAIATDSALSVLISATTKADRWADVGSGGATLGHIVVLDADATTDGIPTGVTGWGRAHIAAAEMADPVPVGPHDLAYLLFTSGSTGRPKGVSLSHENTSAFVHWAARTLRLAPTDRLSSHAPLHFDLSIFDVFATASVAASVTLVPARAAMFPPELAAFIERNEITVWYSVPSALSMLVARGGLTPGAFPSLRAVVFAGEVFPTPQLAALMALVPHAEFWNWYGPTETNVCTAHRVTEAPRPDDPPVPIGAVIDVARGLVVDEHLTPVVAGEEGELLISGPIVTPGYWGDEELTARRLVTVDAHGDQRWYRTGDVVVERPGVGYQFRGRRDHQIKSRGHRIELGEVEAALLRHPSVIDACAVAVPDPLVTNTLVAFVTASAAVDGGALVRHCRGQVPAPMVPTTIHVIDELPRTSTGKTDRVELAARAAADSAR